MRSPGRFRLPMAFNLSRLLTPFRPFGLVVPVAPGTLTECLLSLNEILHDMLNDAPSDKPHLCCTGGSDGIPWRFLYVLGAGQRSRCAIRRMWISSPRVGVSFPAAKSG